VLYDDSQDAGAIIIPYNDDSNRPGILLLKISDGSVFENFVIGDSGGVMYDFSSQKRGWLGFFAGLIVSGGNYYAAVIDIDYKNMVSDYHWTYGIEFTDSNDYYSFRNVHYKYCSSFFPPSCTSTSNPTPGDYY